MKLLLQDESPYAVRLGFGRDAGLCSQEPGCCEAARDML